VLHLFNQGYGRKKDRNRGLGNEPGGGGFKVCAYSLSGLLSKTLSEKGTGTVSTTNLQGVPLHFSTAISSCASGAGL